LANESDLFRRLGFRVDRSPERYVYTQHPGGWLSRGMVEHELDEEHERRRVRMWVFTARIGSQHKLRAVFVRRPRQDRGGGPATKNGKNTIWPVLLHFDSYHPTSAMLAADYAQARRYDVHADASSTLRACSTRLRGGTSSSRRLERSTCSAGKITRPLAVGGYGCVTATQACGAWRHDWIV
jgi:hypothetical protein